MPLRRRRDAGVALRAKPAAPAAVDRRAAVPVTPAGEEVDPKAALPKPPGRRLRVVLASLGALLMLAGAVAYSWWQLRDSEPLATVPPPVVVGDARSVLVVVAGPDGRATSLALFVSDGIDDHRVLVAPPDLTMQIPGYGDGSLGEALAIEDAALVRLSLVNELGIRIDQTITIGPGDI